MRRFVMGFVLGVVVATAAGTVAATCVGSGYLMGWTVTLNGETICEDPYVWSTREIECSE